MSVPHSSTISVDPDGILPAGCAVQFHKHDKEFHHVFDPSFKGYNGAVGPIHAKVKMGHVLRPQRKGCLSQYARNTLEEMQEQFDYLELLGVFVKPEDTDTVVECLNPSFLVKKPSGGSRLVTSIREVGRYAKPQLSLMSNVNSTLQQIAKWKYVITSDLTKAFYQYLCQKSLSSFTESLPPLKV